MTQALDKQSLYERDTLLWIQDTLAKLKVKDFENIDLENLIEEIDELGKSQKKELKSRLLVLLEHLLKRLYVDSPNDFRGWEITIREQRQQIELGLDDSPSLKTLWQEVFDKVWPMALKGVRKDYSRTYFPDCWPFLQDLESILERDFWEEK